MKRGYLAIVGFAVLGLAAAAAYREFAPAGKGAESASIPDVARAPRPLPDVRFLDGAGAPRSLADFPGRVVLLNVWATWCAPCREEMPALDRLQASLGGPGFEVVALSLDRGGAQMVKRFYEELGLRALGIYVDEDGEALSKLGAAGIPLTLLVDRDGREQWRVLGPRNWDQPAEANRIRSHLAQMDK
jgi:thiol-disulfide isomerase/thioredoxin